MSVPKTIKVLFTAILMWPVFFTMGVFFPIVALCAKYEEDGSSAYRFNCTVSLFKK